MLGDVRHPRRSWFWRSLVERASVHHRLGCGAFFSIGLRALHSYSPALLRGPRLHPTFRARMRERTCYVTISDPKLLATVPAGGNVSRPHVAVSFRLAIWYSVAVLVCAATSVAISCVACELCLLSDNLLARLEGVGPSPGRYRLGDARPARTFSCLLPSHGLRSLRFLLATRAAISLQTCSIMRWRSCFTILPRVFAIQARQRCAVCFFSIHRLHFW